MRQAGKRHPKLVATIDADFDQVWYLVSDTGSWPGLMPHIHGVKVLDQRDDRALIRVDARHGWLPVRFFCGVAAKGRAERPEACPNLPAGEAGEPGREGDFHRWYVSGPWRGTVETWRVIETGEKTNVEVSISSPGPVASLARWLVILPLAHRTLSMIQLLGEAHRDVHRDLD